MSETTINHNIFNMITNALSDIIIKKACLDDAIQISQLVIPLTKRFISYEFTTKAEALMLNSMSPQQIRENMEDGYIYFLAYKPINQLIGIVGMTQNAHLYHLFIDENYHKQRIGQLLWQHILSTTQIKKWTVNSSRIAVNFYKKQGFKTIANMKEKNGITYYPMQFIAS